MKTYMKWEDNVRKAVPYVPGEQPAEKNIIKLNTNECPYPPSQMVQKALLDFDSKQLRLYPDTQATELAETLACRYHLSKEQIFVGVGSDDVLAMSFMTFFHSKKPILFPDITYSFYDVWAQLFQIPYQCQPLMEDFHIRKEDYFVENGGIILPNPNAPTGLAEKTSIIEEILQKNPDVVVIIDEAYVDFGAESVLPLIEKYENLLVVQTFSKSRALAGIRIGYAMGSRKLVQYLNDVKFSFNSYTMNSVTVAAGAACLGDEEYFTKTLQKIISTREHFKTAMQAMGFDFPDSKANFIFATHKRVSATEIFEAAKKEGIYLRYFNKPRISDYLRITIGTDQQMEKLLSFLEQFLRQKGILE